MFMSLEYVLTSDTVVPVYKTYGGIYYDKKDYLDGQAYIYVSFLMDTKLELLRVLNSDIEPKVDWSYEFTDLTAT